jgi:hypothetical protein
MTPAALLGYGAGIATRYPAFIPCALITGARLPVLATCRCLEETHRLPPRLPSPFDPCACAAFTATGDSLKHRFEVYSSGSTPLLLSIGFRVTRFGSLSSSWWGCRFFGHGFRQYSNFREISVVTRVPRLATFPVQRLSTVSCLPCGASGDNETRERKKRQRGDFQSRVPFCLIRNMDGWLLVRSGVRVTPHGRREQVCARLDGCCPSPPAPSPQQVEERGMIPDCPGQSRLRRVAYESRVETDKVRKRYHL